MYTRKEIYGPFTINWNQLPYNTGQLGYTGAAIKYVGDAHRDHGTGFSITGVTYNPDTGVINVNTNNMWCYPTHQITFILY